MMPHPFFTYFGGKWRCARHYPGPKFNTIIEPFAGSAGYSVRNAVTHRVILIDRNPVVVATWRYLIGVSAQEILNLPDVPDYQSVDDLKVCQEARYLIGWWLSKGKSAPGKTPNSWMRSRLRPNSFWGEAIRQRIAWQVNLIRSWQVIEGDYHESPNIEATWFVDPPYQVMGKYYKYGSSKIDYAELADWCRSRRGQVIVCENEGADWLPFESWREIKTTRSNVGKALSREVIWTSG